MEKEQALLILVQAAHQAPLNYQSHIAIEQAKVVLAGALGISAKPEPEDGQEEESQVS
jgi:hypothetical protein